MPANRKEPESAPFWFQSATGRPHGGFMPSGAPTAEQQGARMAALCPRVLLHSKFGDSRSMIGGPFLPARLDIHIARDTALRHGL